MNITTHTLPDAHPVGTGCVDGALATVYGTGDPLGAIVGWPLGGGEGLPLGDSGEARPEEIPA
ncbi:hypothetical protein GCM10022255_096690 [Dactylosporangium darangshiense]|uniref:Uncharacterized protein n=1 Tax=Dactylosporangium darangshiense TaxID=579108 RepID=A0ABP8DRA2_9ACTN